MKMFLAIITLVLVSVSANHACTQVCGGTNWHAYGNSCYCDSQSELLTKCLETKSRNQQYPALDVFDCIKQTGAKETVSKGQTPQSDGVCGICQSGFYVVSKGECFCDHAYITIMKACEKSFSVQCIEQTGVKSSGKSNTAFKRIESARTQQPQSSTVVAAESRPEDKVNHPETQQEVQKPVAQKESANSDKTPETKVASESKDALASVKNGSALRFSGMVGSLLALVLFI